MQSDALWHPLDSENYRKPALVLPVLAERRSKARFPIDLPVRFNAGRETGFSGTGRVVNIGSTDVLVACLHKLRLGALVELVIEWPARLDGTIPIHLVMTGRVMRSNTAGFAAGACQHRFRLVGGAPSEAHAELITSLPHVSSVYVEPVLTRLPAPELRAAQPL